MGVTLLYELNHQNLFMYSIEENSFFQKYFHWFFLFRTDGLQHAFYTPEVSKMTPSDF